MKWRRSAAGAVAALLGTSVSVLLAAAVSTVLRRFPFPILVVAERVAGLAPGRIASFFIDALQHKALPLTVLATSIGLFAGAALLGTLLPRLTRRLPRLAAAVAVAVPIYLIGLWAFHPSEVTVGLPVYALLLAACVLPGAWIAARSFAKLTAEVPSEAQPATARGSRQTRRTFLRAAWLGSVGVAIGWAQLGRVLFPRPDPGRQPLKAGDVVTATPPPTTSADAGFDAIPGLASLITPNATFYTVNEEIIDPDVEVAAWSLSVGGLVERPYSLTYQQLLDMPSFEQYTTLECISNPVGGDLISNAKWTGVKLSAILERAGVRSGALEVISRSVSGYSDSIPLQDAVRPDTLVVIGMNGMTLPRAHGFPARLLAPGHYGMKQPKWLTSIDVVDQPYQGYWETRGWTKPAIVKTMSRIDATAQGAAGWVAAGVAFAGDRGIAKVEVSLDGGQTWQEAELETALSHETWRRWRLPFDRAAATIVIVRATDGDGVAQISTPADPHPSGASGYQQVGL